MTRTIGFIGLGNMGAGMAKKLMAAGFDVCAYDTDREKLQGLKTTNSIKELSSICETVVLCLPNPDASRQVLHDLLQDESVVNIVIETSTLTPEIVQNTAAHLSDRGVSFVSAPMVGGKQHAIDGTIVFLVEGKREAFEACTQLFSAMGSSMRYMGDVPSATLAKIAFNLCRYANLATATSVYRMLEPFNPDMKSVHAFLTQQSLDNFGQVWAEDMQSTYYDGSLYAPSKIPEKDLMMFAQLAANSTDRELIESIRNVYKSL